VKLLGYSLVEPLSLVMEFVEFGSLYDLFQHRTVKFDWKLRMRIALDVAQGLHFLHSMQYIHKDVKSPNILISSTNPLDAAVAKGPSDRYPRALHAAVSFIRFTSSRRL
jgi:serine/threonine protein kinase